MSSAQERKCPDCDGTTKHIRLIDKAHGGGNTDLQYAVPEADRSFWMARFPIAGTVAAYMCDHCGRILLYGEEDTK